LERRSFMKLSTYFENTRGTGVMATANSRGEIDAAVYDKPFFLDEETVAFLMADGLTRNNLDENPRAAFLFTEGEDAGRRVYLTKIREDEDDDITEEILNRLPAGREGRYRSTPKRVVYFHIDRIRALVGE